MKFYTFFGAQIVITAIIVTVLFDMSRKPISTFIESPIIQSLQPYFEVNSLLYVIAVKCMFVASVAAITMTLSYFILKELVPTTSLQMFYYFCILIPISYSFAYLFKALHQKVLGDEEMDTFFETTHIGIADSMLMLLTSTLAYIGVKHVLRFKTYL